MTSTAFKITPSMRERLAKVHQRGDNDAFTPQMDLEIPQEPSSRWVVVASTERPATICASCA